MPTEYDCRLSLGKLYIFITLYMQGTVKFYNDQKGFGFIMPEDGSQDIFFHITQCAESYELPQEGDSVMFDLGEGRDGRPAATNVQFGGAAAPADESSEMEDEQEEQEEQEQEELQEQEA